MKNDQIYEGYQKILDNHLYNLTIFLHNKGVK